MKNQFKPKNMKQLRGFAVMTKAEVRRISSLGGLKVSKNRKHMSEIGAIGGGTKRKRK